MTQAKFPMMLDEERAKYVTRELKYEQTINQQAAQIVMLRDALKQVSGHIGLYNLFSCEGGDSYDPECAELNLDKIRPIADEALTATADLDGLILCHAEPCRDDGRCQYAIDHGAEGLGHCPEGKCCMPLYRAWEPTK